MVAKTFTLWDAEFGGDVAGGDLRCQFTEGVALFVVSQPVRTSDQCANSCTAVS